VKGFAYIDGSCIGNPGDAAYAVVLTDESGNTLESVARYIGKATNNIAEFRGLLGCLELAMKYRMKRLTVYSDSQLLVNQVNGSYKIKAPHLKTIHEMIREAADSGSISYTIHFIQRENNKVADGLARRAARSRTDVEE
jgi:ribonuclease HI